MATPSSIGVPDAIQVVNVPPLVIGTSEIDRNVAEIELLEGLLEKDDKDSALIEDSISKKVTFQKEGDNASKKRTSVDKQNFNALASISETNNSEENSEKIGKILYTHVETILNLLTKEIKVEVTKEDCLLKSLAHLENADFELFATRKKQVTKKLEAYWTKNRFYKKENEVLCSICERYLPSPIDVESSILDQYINIFKPLLSGEIDASNRHPMGETLNHNNFDDEDSAMAAHLMNEAEKLFVGKYHLHNLIIELDEKRNAHTTHMDLLKQNTRETEELVALVRYDSNDLRKRFDISEQLDQDAAQKCGSNFQVTKLADIEKYLSLLAEQRTSKIEKVTVQLERINRQLHERKIKLEARKHEESDVGALDLLTCEAKNKQLRKELDSIANELLHLKTLWTKASRVATKLETLYTELVKETAEIKNRLISQQRIVQSLASSTDDDKEAIARLRKENTRLRHTLGLVGQSEFPKVEAYAREVLAEEKLVRKVIYLRRKVQLKQKQNAKSKSSTAKVAKQK